MQTFSRLDAGARPRAATDAPSLIPRKVTWPENGGLAERRAAHPRAMRRQSGLTIRQGFQNAQIGAPPSGAVFRHGRRARGSRRVDETACIQTRRHRRAEVIVAGGAQPASPRRVGERRLLRLTFAGTCPHATEDHDDSDVRDRDSVGGLCGPPQLPAPSPLPPAGRRCYPAFFGSRGIRIQRAT
jgi:hypothetical protein